MHDVPPIRFEALADVVAVGQRGVAVDGDVVVVVDADQVAETLMAGKRGGLVADALHEAAVAGDDEGVVVDDVVAELRAKTTFGDRHADGVGETLAERPGGHFDARGVVCLGMAGCERAPLAEGFDVVELEPVAGEVRTSSTAGSTRDRWRGRTVTVGPVWVRRIVMHHAAEEHMS